MLQNNVNRNLDYLHRKRFEYKKEPTTDVPTKKYYWGSYYKNGTYGNYHLFCSTAKITTYKSLSWHIFTLRYININLDEVEFKKIIYFIADIKNGFVTFEIKRSYVDGYVDNALSSDFSILPHNKLRRVIFKDGTGLSKKQKLKIVGEICGKEKSIDSDCIYECMLYINGDKRKITITNIAKMLNCSRMSIYRNMNTELKEERDLLNMSV